MRKKAGHIATVDARFEGYIMDKDGAFWSVVQASIAGLLRPHASIRLTMDGQFTLFPHLPQEIQDEIWLLSMLPSYPCVQALGFYGPPLLEYYRPFEMGLFGAFAPEPVNSSQHIRRYPELQFSLPAPTLVARSQFRHNNAQIATVCRAAHQAFARACARRKQEEEAEKRALEAYLHPKIREDVVHERRTMLTICVPKGGPNQEQSNAVDERLAITMGDTTPQKPHDSDSVLIFVNPKSDILWLDLQPNQIHDPEVCSASKCLATLLSTAGVYSSELMVIERIAIEFTEPQIRKLPSSLHLYVYPPPPFTPDECSTQQEMAPQLQWCDRVKAAAHFWPLTTPNLQTLYIIDRRIKLIPGASPRKGTPTYQGNGCTFVEVPFPKKRRLEKGVRDTRWEYPPPGPGNTSVFTFVRHIRTLMAEHKRNLRKGRIENFYGMDKRIRSLTKPRVDFAQNRAILHGEIPEVKVLAIVE